MKKKIIIVLAVIFGLLLLHILINQIDGSAPTDGFTRADLPKQDFSPDNGFYKLFTLSMADDADIHSKEVIEKIRALNDPAYDNDKHLEQWSTKEYLGFSRARNKKIKEKAPNRGAWFNYPEDPEKNWLESIQSNPAELEFMKNELAVWLKRYQAMIESPAFSDFSRLHFLTPIPNLLAWLHTAKIYNIINMLDAVSGNWERGVNNIIGNINLIKRGQKGSLVMITNLVGKAIGTHSLRALAAIMNHKDCPREIYEKILKGLPTITYEEFGTRNSFIAESMFLISNFEDSADGKTKGGSFWQKLMKALYLQKNKTHRKQIDMMRYFIEMEETPPYKWKEPIKQFPEYASGWFWWIVNPVGKKWLDYLAFPSQGKVIVKSYRFKVYYDLTRICAQLHLNYTGDKPVSQILNTLETYRSPDPFSGESYRWNEQKQILYSIGTNFKDDNGVEEFKTHDKDFIIPCVLYVK